KGMERNRLSMHISGCRAKMKYSRNSITDQAVYTLFRYQSCDASQAKDIVLAYEKGDKNKFLHSMNECGANAVVSSGCLKELFDNRNNSPVQIPLNVIVFSNPDDSTALLCDTWDPDSKAFIRDWDFTNLQRGSWYVRGHALGPQWLALAYISEHVFNKNSAELRVEHDHQEHIRGQLGWLGVPVFDFGGHKNPSGWPAIEYRQDPDTGRFKSARFIPSPEAECTGIAMLGEPSHCGAFDMLSNMDGKPNRALPVTYKGAKVCEI
ncbi:MAG: hypothetical protein FWF01_01855, partial [Alphaproteobacteria bacterium]|nr:hypothetical protein [Alphaproteobacteria bacterium]